MKACVVCGRATTGPRCPEHGGDRRSLTTDQRGYTRRHKNRRTILIANAIGTPCPLCNITMKATDRLDLDHRVPLSEDPSSIGDRITHAHCNRRRRPGRADTPTPTTYAPFA